MKKIVVSDKLRRYAADLELEPANGAHRRAFHSVVIPNACKRNDRVTARKVSRDVSKKGMGVRAGCAKNQSSLPVERIESFLPVVWREKREASCVKACLASIIIDRTRRPNYQRAKVIR